MVDFFMIKYIFVLGLLVFSLSVQVQVMFGVNFIVNGDVENGVVGWIGFDGYVLFQFVDYGSNWVLFSQLGLVDCGSKMFIGVGGQSVGFQILLFDVFVGQLLCYDVGGWLGGWFLQGDNVLFYVFFLDVQDNEVGYVVIGLVMLDDCVNQMGLFYCFVLGVLFVGMVLLMFLLLMECQGGGGNDGYADNLFFVIFSVFEGSMWVYVLVGFGLLGVVGVCCCY